MGNYNDLMEKHAARTVDTKPVSSRSTGWVVVTKLIPDKPFIVESSFSDTKSGAIKSFISKSTKTWPWYRRRWGAECVRCEAIYKINL